jgi:hypothetical protein
MITKIRPAQSVAPSETVKPKTLNREAWLTAAAHEITPLIQEVTGLMEPSFRVSVGFPSKRGLARTRRVIGECHHHTMSQDGVREMFIHPQLAEWQVVGGTLAHELVHAFGFAGHRKDFANVAYAIGLKGKPTATVPGDKFLHFFDPIQQKLGPYPHAALAVRPTGGGSPTNTYMRKRTCEGCGYLVRTTDKWLSIAEPTCPDPNCEQYGEVMEGR